MQTAVPVFPGTRPYAQIPFQYLLHYIENEGGDLLTPFQSGYYYNRAIGGSFSIKTVLPAICPDDPALDYHNLEGVHHGGEAMALFPKIRDMEPAEREQARRALLKYCELDTLAMVRVWEELLRTARGGYEDE